MMECDVLSRHYCLDAIPLHLELRDALRDTHDRLAGRGVELYLMGGVAASLLAHDAWPARERPLSRDLDFLVPGDDATRGIIEEEYGGAFRVHAGKAVFKSYKLQTSAPNGVELDFIASSNIVHDDGGLSSTVTPTVCRLAQREELLGVPVLTLPPALVALQKLYAGRGRDLGKYDLCDAQALLRSGCVDPDLFALFLREAFPAGLQSLAAARMRSALLQLQPSPEVQALLPLLGTAPEELRSSVAADIRSLTTT